MGLRYENLDTQTRALMLSEIERDADAGTIYISNYLNDEGRQSFLSYLRDAAQAGSDDSLAEDLNRSGSFKQYTERRKPKGGTTMVAVPVTAAQTLAEAQFNVYYMRALALRALQDNLGLLVYRAKDVTNPRTTSLQMIGSRLDPAHVLEALRNTQGVEPPTDIPLPNTGITVSLC